MENFEKLYDSLKLVYFQVCFDLTETKKAITILEMEKRKLEAEKILKDRIVHEVITKSNKKNNEYLEEIKSLRDEIAKIKKSIFEKAPVLA